MKKKIPISALNRSKKILGTTLKIASKEIQNQARTKLSKLEEVKQIKTRVEQAKLLAKTLGELKGGAMKVGQMLSIDSDDWLPKEVTQILSNLQNSSVEIDREIMISLLKNEVTDDIFYEINIEKEALASASIGQVYKATYKGTKIIIKIQYPNIANTIDSDLKLIKPLISNFSKILGKKIDYSEMFNEIRDVLKKEIDYNLEANNIFQYRENFSSYKDYLVPNVIPEISTQKVLAMDYLDGVTLNEWIEKNPPIEDKEKIAKMILNLFKIEFFKFGLVQTDPNPANFLIQENPLRIVLLDLGACINYNKQFIENYKTLVKSVLDLDKEKVVECFVHSDMLDNRENEECIENFIKMQFHAARPFLKEYQPFDYSNEIFNKDLKINGFRFVKSLKYSSPPKELIFLHRKLGGIFLILKRLKVKINTGDYFDDIL